MNDPPTETPAGDRGFRAMYPPGADRSERIGEMQAASNLNLVRPVQAGIHASPRLLRRVSRFPVTCSRPPLPRPMRSMRTVAIRTATVLPLLLPGMLAAQEITGARDGHALRVDSVFAAYDKPGVPGCAVGVYRDDRMVYARGYGLADLEHAVPITPHTVFDLGSTSKQFTASAILLLAGDGKLSLDDDVRRWLPELPAYTRPITIRNLLNHTSGLRDYIVLMAFGGNDFGSVTTEDEALAAVTRQRETNFAPGDEFLYSNTGYFLLSEIVKRASGQHLRDFARERIFTPLGMRRTHILSDYSDVVPDRALAYGPRDGGGYRMDVSRWLQTGDGAVFSTVEELLLWDRNFYDPKVGGEALLAGLQTPGKLANGRELDYGAGLFLGRHRGLRTVRHGGAWGGYRAELLRVPDAHFSTAVLCNVGTSDPSALATSVAEIYLEDRMEPAARRLPSAAASSRPAVRVAAARLQALAGLYRDSVTLSTRTITFDAGKLWIGTDTRLELRPLSQTEFEAVGAAAPTRIRFEPAVAGRASRLVRTVEGSPPFTAEKLALVTPTPDELAAYAGTYSSEELQTSWRFTVEDGALVAHAPRTPLVRLRPFVRDEFGGVGMLRFTRDANATVTGILLQAGRVRNVRFVRSGNEWNGSKVR